MSWAFVLASLGRVSGVAMMNNTRRFPACVDDSDCRRLESHVCFQYFCYPWQPPKALASDEPLPLELCRMDKDCRVKNGAKQRCFKHHDKRKITSGICIPSEDTCTSHKECEGKGGKCCNSYCCNEVYFEAIGRLPCVSNEGCRVRKKSHQLFLPLPDI